MSSLIEAIFLFLSDTIGASSFCAVAFSTISSIIPSFLTGLIFSTAVVFIDSDSSLASLFSACLIFNSKLDF